MRFGSIAVRVVSDGSFLLDGGPVFGIIPKTLWERTAKPDRKNRVRLGLNSTLVRTPSGNILVDCGIGNKDPETSREVYGHSSSKLLRNLRKLGVAARDIGWVVLTHLHFDHSGGATRLDREGNLVPTFPRAKYLVQRSSWEEAFNPSERSLPSLGNGCGHLKIVEERGQLVLLDGDTEIAPGVRAHLTGGPSAGHQVVTVDSGSERFVTLGDLIPTPNHLPLPCITAFDRTPDVTLAKKKELLERCEREGWLMIFSHGYDDYAGYIERRRGAAALRPIAV
ncbi:MAG: MBL fold metallo-hydrolase [Gemmatimonadetes bacterium]|nr:MBL fold metallo-hydrolase [Gemmatimonadota bacterium]